MQDYHQSKKINCSPAKCFVALTQHIALWWSQRTEGNADIVGAEFTVCFDNTFKRMKVIELIHNQKIVWQCIDSHLDLDSLKNKAEWNDTRIEWIIETSEGGITLNVTHVGLNESIGCYDACEKGWDHFLTSSLLPFLENGKGQPYQSK